MKPHNVHCLLARIGIAAVLAAPASATACGLFVGEICTFGFEFCPTNAKFLPADGRLLSIAEYRGLFDVIGIRYGGDGRSTFALPDMRSRTVIGASSSGSDPLPGDKMGSAEERNFSPVHGAGGIRVPAAQSQFVGLTRCIVAEQFKPLSKPGTGYTGEIITFAGATCPEGTTNAEGQALPISGNENLSAVIGTVYGSNGGTTVIMPNLVARTTMGKGYNPFTRVNLNLGQTTAAPTPTLGMQLTTSRGVFVPITQSPSLALLHCVWRSGLNPR